MGEFPQLFALGAFGAAALEFLGFRELYGKLSSRRFRMLVGCPAFWLICFGFIICSGVFTYVVLDGRTGENMFTAVLAGAGFRSFGREGIGAAIHNKAISQGGEAGTGEPPISMREIFA